MISLPPAERSHPASKKLTSSGRKQVRASRLSSTLLSFRLSLYFKDTLDCTDDWCLQDTFFFTAPSLHLQADLLHLHLCSVSSTENLPAGKHFGFLSRINPIPAVSAEDLERRNFLSVRLPLSEPASVQSSGEQLGDVWHHRCPQPIVRWQWYHRGNTPLLSSAASFTVWMDDVIVSAAAQPDRVTDEHTDSQETTDEWTTDGCSANLLTDWGFV